MNIKTLAALAVAVFLLVPAKSPAADSGVDLAKSVNECLSYSPHLKSLQSEQVAVSRDLRSAWGGYLPSIDLAGGYGTEQYDAAATRLTGDEHLWDERFEATATITQLIWDGNGQVKLIERAGNRLDRAEKSVFEGAEALALAAINAHLAVVRQRALVSLSEDNLARHKEIVAALEQIQQLGGGSRADMTQAQGRQYLAESTLVEQRQRLQDAIAQYEYLVGHLPGELSMPDIPVVEYEALDPFVASVEQTNPQIKVKMADVEIARDTTGVAASKFYPKFYVEGQASYQDQVEGLLKNYSNTNYVMVKTEWNIYRGGSDYADHDAALQRTIKARKDLEDTHDSVVEEAKNTWFVFDASKRNMENYGSAVKYNTDTRDMYILQFNVGQRSLLDVLDAENELFTSSGKLVTTKTNAVYAAYKILALQGKLLSQMGIEASLYEPKAE